MTDTCTTPKKESSIDYVGKHEGIFLDPGISMDMKRFTPEEAYEFIGCDNPLITHIIVFKPYNVYENEMPEFIHLTALTNPLMVEKFVYQKGDVTGCPASAFAPSGFARNSLPALLGKTVFIGKKHDGELFNSPFGQDVKDLKDLLDREGDGKPTVPRNVIPLFRAKTIKESTSFFGQPGISQNTRMFWFLPDY